VLHLADSEYVAGFEQAPRGRLLRLDPCASFRTNGELGVVFVGTEPGNKGWQDVRHAWSEHRHSNERLRRVEPPVVK
jgi:hypothetical protein